MKTLIFLLSISRLTLSGVLPVPGVAVLNAPSHSQFLTQDNFGQYIYGYASHNHAKNEIKTGDITKGGYSYIDSNGLLQSIEYISDPVNGFRVSATNLPRDLPEVALAKIQHHQEFERIKTEHALLGASQNSGLNLSPVPPNGGIVVPISASSINIPHDLPEVALAKIQHQEAYRKIQQEHAANQHLQDIYNLSPLPASGGVIVPVTSSVAHTPVVPSSQYHTQDQFGQYTYGYTGPLSSKSEIKTADGVVRGGYSYIDANGILQSIQYISDPVHGFQVQGTNLPEAPVVTLVEPKVTSTVVGPSEQPAVLSNPIDSPVLTAPLSQNPIIVETPEQPILTEPRNLSPENVVPQDNVHYVPFPSNGHILTQNPEVVSSIVAQNSFPPQGSQIQNVNYQYENPGIVAQPSLPAPGYPIPNTAQSVNQYENPGISAQPSFSPQSYPIQNIAPSVNSQYENQGIVAQPGLHPQSINPQYVIPTETPGSIVIQNYPNPGQNPNHQLESQLPNFNTQIPPQLPKNQVPGQNYELTVQSIPLQAKQFNYQILPEVNPVLNPNYQSVPNGDLQFPTQPINYQIEKNLNPSSQNQPNIYFQPNLPYSNPSVPSSDLIARNPALLNQQLGVLQAGSGEPSRLYYGEQIQAGLEGGSATNPQSGGIADSSRSVDSQGPDASYSISTHF